MCAHFFRFIILLGCPLAARHFRFYDENLFAQRRRSCVKIVLVQDFPKRAGSLVAASSFSCRS